jgi:hypothetical protein
MITFVIITKEDTGSNRFLKLSPTKSKGDLLDTNFFEELAFPSKKQIKPETPIVMNSAVRLVKK